MKIHAAVLMLVLLGALTDVNAQTPVQPTLPQKTVGLTMPAQGTAACPSLTTGSNCVRTPGASAANFQSALNAATCGDTIVLQAGYTYSGNFTVPATTCTSNSGWVVIQSSALSSLPASGTRVSPSNVSNMAILSTPNTSAAIQFNAGSNHWRLIGLEITTSVSNSSGMVYTLVGMGTGLTSASQLPSYIIFDRTYLYGSTVTPITRAIWADAAYFALVDSYCDEIVASGNDAQCVLSVNGTGPFLIQNNFLQASGENIMFGGADPSITNLVPSDITIIGNVLQKNTAWIGIVSDVKDHFELKNAQRVLLDGNVLQYTWAAGQNESVIVRSVNQSGACTWCVVQNVTITHNLINHAPQGIVVGADDCGTNNNNYACIVTQNVLVRNNLLLDISSVNWGEGIYNLPDIVQLDPDNQGGYQMTNVIVDHNTGFEDTPSSQPNGPPYGTGMSFESIGTVSNVQITNNIFNYGVICCGGITGQGTSSGTSTLSTFAPSAVYNDVVLLNATGSSSGYPTYPSGTYWNTLAGTGFTSYSGTYPALSGNFQLTSSSPYYRAGTDGNDIGVYDWACFNADTTAALAGDFVPSPGCTPSASSSLMPPPSLTGTLMP